MQEVRNQTDKFGLLEDFSEVFSYDNKNNKEIIFAIRNARDEYNMWGDVTYNNNMFPQQIYYSDIWMRMVIPLVHWVIK